MTGAIDEATELCRNPHVLPVVFVPGIMGSRLRQRGSGDRVWDPVSRSFLWQYAAASAATRRALLIGPPTATFNQNFLDVDHGDSARMGEFVGAPFGAEKHDRGWGGLVWSFYGPFMQWLEGTLPSLLARRNPSMGCLFVEAFAEPYNWAGDNGVAAQGLDRRVAQAVTDSKAKYSDRSPRMLDPIVITHSMGGLVGRAFAKKGAQAGTVKAVIHGAMPTQGSPAAYKRLMSGFEGAASVALGITGAEVTAVGASSPGVLQLLPGQFHEDRSGDQKWLKFSIEDQVFHSEPSGDPYFVIYAREDVWWRPVRRGSINPSVTDPIALQPFWTSYLGNLQIARNFHSSLGSGAGGFHPNTYMLYSDNISFPSWDHVEWRANTPTRTTLSAPEPVQVFGWNTPIDSRSTEDAPAPELNGMLQEAMRSHRDHDGWNISTSFPIGAKFDLGSNVPENVAGERLEATALMQNADAAGDGTVHAGSGIRVVRSIESEATQAAVGGNAGYAHDQCFNSEDVRQQVAGLVFDEVNPQL